MEPSKLLRMAGASSGRRWLVGVIVSVVVLGGALSAGSALGKKGNPEPGNDDTAPGQQPDVQVHAPVSLIDASGNQTAAFEIKDFSFGIENPTTVGSASGGAGTGKVKFNDFTIKKQVDKSSVLLFEYCAKGEHFKDVVIVLNQTAERNTSTYMEFTFGTVFVTNIQTSGSGSGGDVPMESVTFVFGSLEIKYKPQDPSNATSFAFDQTTNSIA